MGRLIIKKGRKNVTKKSVAFAGVFTDSSVASRHALRRKLPNCGIGAIGELATEGVARSDGGVCE